MGKGKNSSQKPVGILERQQVAYGLSKGKMGTSFGSLYWQAMTMYGQICLGRSVVLPQNISYT